MSHRPAPLALAAVLAIGLGACTSSTSGGGSPSPAALSPSAAVASTAASASPVESPSPSPSPAESSSPAASAAGLSGATAVPTSVDPCQVITAAEAGQLAGASFGPGKESTTSGNARMCVYGAQTKNVFTVTVAIAPDAATAKQQESAAQAELQASAAQIGGLGITQLPGFAPNTDAVLLKMPPNSLHIDGGAIYLIRGTTFFGFSDLVLGATGPSSDAMKAQAMTALGRLP